MHDAVPQPLEPGVLSRAERHGGGIKPRQKEKLNLTQIYEGMFLLDNDLVRGGWDGAKGVVTAALEKHGGKVHTARRWDERRLAYPIRRKQRATYLLTYYEIPGDSIPAMRREFDLSEQVLRYLMLAVEAIPEGESDLAAAEQSPDFVLPEPPADDAVDEEEEEEAPSGEAEAAGGEAADEAAGEGTAEASAGAEEAPAAEAPADKAPAAEASSDGEAEASGEAAGEPATEENSGENKDG